MATKAELEAELAALKEQHERFRHKVVEVANDYKDNHGWCNEVDAALRDMGLTDLVPSLKRKVTLVYEIDGTEWGLDDESVDDAYVEVITDQIGSYYDGLEFIDSKVEEVEPAAA